MLSQALVLLLLLGIAHANEQPTLTEDTPISIEVTADSPIGAVGETSTASVVVVESLPPVTYHYDSRVHYYPMPEDEAEYPYLYKHFLLIQKYQSTWDAASPLNLTSLMGVVVDDPDVNDYFAPNETIPSDGTDENSPRIPLIYHILTIHVAQLEKLPAVLARHSAYATKIREWNDHCQHLELNATYYFDLMHQELASHHTETSPVDFSKYEYRLDAYFCSHDFMGVDPDTLGSAECLRSTNQNCTGNSSGPTRKALFDNYFDTGSILDWSQFEERPRPTTDQMFAYGPGPDHVDNSHCMELHLPYAPDRIMTNAALGPDFASLPNHTLVTIASVHPLVVVLDNYITDAENEHMLELGRPLLNHSGVLGSETLEETRRYRSSFTAFLVGHENDTVHLSLKERSINFTRFTTCEDLQVLRYQHTQRYDAHWDWFPIMSGQADAVTSLGQRTATLFIYLTSLAPHHHGETNFPHVRDIKVRPVKNRAVFWYNILPNGIEDERSLHAGLPVDSSIEQDGAEKWALNVWLRDSRLVGPVRTCDEMNAERDGRGADRHDDHHDDHHDERHGDHHEDRHDDHHDHVEPLNFFNDASVHDSEQEFVEKWENEAMLSAVKN